MKGQTTIELKNVKTGEVERYVDNNMMTNAVNEVMKTRGLMANCDIPRDELYKSLLGGILLFDTQIEEDADNVFPPATATMVGNAANGVLSSDNVTEMGSFNDNESGWQRDGSYLAVYDFTTSQANGTIASVCLTSDICGYVGFGNNTSNNVKSSLSNVFARMYATYGYRQTGYYPIRIDYTASTVDMVAAKYLSGGSEYFADKGKLVIEKFQIPLSRLNLAGTPTQFLKLSEVEVTIPSEWTYNQSRLAFDEGDIYIIPANITWASNQVIKINKHYHIIFLEQ